MEIRYFCMEDIDCRARNGEQAFFSDTELNDCMELKSADLDGDSAAAARFETGVVQCNTLRACEYVDCLDSGSGAAPSYADTIIDKITHKCEAKVFCLQAGDIKGCIATEKLVVNNFNDTQKIQYNDAYDMCSARVGCEFETCFFPF